MPAHAHSTADLQRQSRMGTYQRRRPERSAAYQVVQQQLETWLAEKQLACPDGQTIPHYIDRDLREFLRCGILAHGFSRARCEGCGHDFLIAFSCKGRGICPSCNTKRMAQTAAHLVENVLPEVPLRQVVISFPKWLRHYLRQDAGLFNRVIRIVQDETIRTVKAHCPEAPVSSEAGGITFIHRFGSALNVHPHLHLILIDGLISTHDSILRFHPADFSVDEVEALREAIRARVLRLFKRRRLLPPEVVDNLKAWGHGGGFSIHAEVCVPAHDKAGRERLLRYCARPIFASERLSWLKPGETLRYRLAKPGPKGEKELILTPHDFLDRMAALIPPPRKHRHRYFGMLAPNSPQRKALVAQAGLPLETDRTIPVSEAPRKSEKCKPVIPRLLVNLWAVLIARIYAISPLLCPNCGTEMRIIAFIEDINPVRRILGSIGEPVEPPRIHPPRAPPDWPVFDQTITLDEEINQDPGDWGFDQSVSW